MIAMLLILSLFVPGVRYEAERASLDGKAALKGPTTDQKEIAAQASDNRYVELPAAILHSTAAFAGAVQSWRNDGGVLRVAADGGEISIAPLESGAFRFVAGKPCKFGFAVESDGRLARADIGERGDEIVVACGHATVAVEKSTGCFRLYDHSGRMLVREVPGARRFAPDGSARAEDRFAVGKNDAAYGLGQFRDGRLNLRGTRRDLLQENKKAAVPVVYSTGGWGILWNNPSRTAFSDDGNGMSFSSEWGEGIDAYLFAAPSLDGLVAQYRRLSGHVPMMPRWALGYHQSRNRYHDEKQLFEVAARMRREGIPMDSIFIDYFWWGGNGTGSMRFDTKAWPDPKAMAERLRGEFGTHSVITVWPCFKPGTANYDAMKSEGLLVEGATALDGTVYDVCNPKARAKYRELLKPLVDTGMDGFFLDGPEPDHVTPWSKATTHLGPARQVRNLYPLLHAMNFRAALDEYRPGRRHYMITRCAFAGQQRTGTAVWSGDIPATIDELRIQVAAGLNFTATGIPYWTTDIGGYHGGNPASEEYRETFARWFEYGAFCPVFRCHGRREPFDRTGLNELWEYGEKVKGICADYIRLRHRLMPYVYSLSARTTFDDYTPMRLLAFDFPDDEKALDCRDEFMYGPAFLVCPVLELGATSRSVYLPKDCEWIDFWSGERHAGGKTVDAAAPLERIPLFVRAGSIVPTSDAVEIYGGADGSFELYSDDGESLGYLAGDYRRIPVAWDDAKKTVVLGRTKKATPTTFRFRLKGTDEERAVDYCGERVELKFPASSFSPQEGAVPGVRYEAECASLDGKAALKGPTTDQKEIAAQASDNRYVELPAAGSGLTWTVGEDGADGVTLRFTMPDRADGWKQANPDDEVPQYRRADVFDGALEVRVNGKARKVRQYGAVSDRVPLSSYWMWQYFNGDHPADEPDAPHEFARFAFDEVHFILDGAPLRKGDRLSLVNPDGKFPYGVDFVELEKVPAPIPQPANALSVADFGTGREAIDRCFAACREQRKTMYFPAGVWEYWAKTGDNRWLLSGASNLKITGAGVWHTNLHFPGSKSFGGGVGGDRKAVGTEFCHLYLSSMLRSRFNQNAVYKGIMEAWGDKASIHDLWIEHFECGMWFGDYQSPALPTTNARIFSCRIRNNLADGVNLCQGTSDTVIERCSFRGNGDDGIAIWNNDACGAQDTVRNVIRDNVIECNWRAGSIAIFGGDGHLIANNLIKDGYKGAGIRLNTDFPGHQFRNTKLIRFVSNTVVNCGTFHDCYGHERGAIDVDGNVRNVRFENNRIRRAHAKAVRVSGEPPGVAFVSDAPVKGARFVSTTFDAPWEDLTDTVRPSAAASGPRLVLDGAAADQEVLGFGTALSELSWKALSALEYPIWNGVLDEIFKAGGANLTVIRLPMGASDFALDWYSYDEEPGDFNMDKFSTARENDTLLPLLRAILERNRDEARVWASPWSPPRWMKKSGCYASKPQADPRAPQNDCTPAKRVREGEDGFICDDAHFAAYARYFRRYVDGYKSAGFPMWAVMPQNEFNSDQVFPSCTWKASSLARFMGKYLGPALEGSGVELFFGTMERPSFEMARTVLDDPDCRKYVKGAGFQWAGKDAIGPVHRKYPGLFLMQTEQECGDGRNDWTHARHCWDLMRHYFSNGASAYEYWNLALASDSVSRWGWRQNSLVTVDVKAKTYRFNAEYYVLKQLSHFVKRGAKRLKTANGDWIAFRNPDGSVVVGLGNKGPAREVTVACGGRVRAVELPADSVSTLVLAD